MKVTMFIHKSLQFVLEAVNLYYVKHYLVTQTMAIALPVINIKKSMDFFDYFEKEEQYYEIKAILIKEKLIAALTFNWIDRDKGSKAHLIALIKRLLAEGYYKKDKKFTNEAIMELCTNTFSIKVSESHVKHVKYNDININYLPDLGLRLN